MTVNALVRTVRFAGTIGVVGVNPPEAPRSPHRLYKDGKDAFADGPWGAKYPAIAMAWRRHWPAVIPFFAFPADVQRLIYTTNAIEALSAKLRRAVRTRGHFPSDESALKLLFLVLNLAEKEWRMPPREWAMAKAQFAILFEERFQVA